MDVMHKLEQGIFDWYNNEKDSAEPNKTTNNVRQYLNMYVQVVDKRDLQVVKGCSWRNIHTYLAPAYALRPYGIHVLQHSQTRQ
eukprot:jgi/Botrbrau1/7437/Bobra.0083s0010.1